MDDIFKTLDGSIITPANAMQELHQYRQIGTVDECREAVEKQKPREPLSGADIAGREYKICRACSAIVQDGGWFARYCPDCGQAINWEGECEND